MNSSKRVAVFIGNYNIGNNPSIINLLELLAEDFRVDLYLRGVGIRTAKVLGHKSIKVIDVPGRYWPGHIKNKIRCLFVSYDIHICIEPYGFILCKELYPRSRPIYYSMELNLKNDHMWLHYPDWVMRKERAEINSIKGLIIQSEEKEAIFRKDYKLSDEIPAMILPITFKGSSVSGKSRAIRDKYGIDGNMKIALNLGGINDKFHCIELAMAFAKLNGWILFFHGNRDARYVEEMNKTIDQYNINNVIISNEFYDSLEAMFPVLMSCDIGVAWYDQPSLNFTTAGRSSGKIASYLKFGIPVIGKRTVSMKEAIEDTGCGICVEDFTEIGGAIRAISHKYNEYSDNARREFEKTYRFENYAADIIEFIS